MKSNIQNKIIVFDFDGTITTKDTFRLFLFYHSGLIKWVINMVTLFPSFLLYLLKIIDEPYIPELKNGPNRKSIAFIGFFIGVLISSFASIIFCLRSDES